MNRKILTSIITMGIIATSTTNAAITKEQCNRSDKTIWVENVANADGSRGACAPKNTCKSKTFKSNFCITAFEDIQVASVDDAHKAINLYVKTQLGWTAGCTQFLDFDVNNLTGQDYIGCISNGKYRTFEIDDTEDGTCRTTSYSRSLCLSKALCIATGGQYNLGTCNSINQTSCSSINGNYDPSIPTCRLIEDDDGEAGRNAMGFGSPYENYMTR